MNKEDIKEGFSRRSVLKGAAALGAIAAGGGVALNLSLPGSAEAAIRKLPAKWDEEVDVLIIGSGFAGLAAAAEASSRGRKVLILEKMPTYGGNSIINGGEYASSDDKYHIRQKLNLGEDSTKQHFDDTLKGGDYYNNPALVKIMVEGAPGTLNWMMDEGGLQMRENASRAGGHTAYRAGHALPALAGVIQRPSKRWRSKAAQRSGSATTSPGSGARIGPARSSAWKWPSERGPSISRSGMPHLCIGRIRAGHKDAAGFQSKHHAFGQLHES